MSSEMVFRVEGSSAVEAEPISLAEAGLKERAHLQEWVIAHPKMLGDDVKIVGFEYGRWTSSSGLVEKDRLDVLGLDREGRLVVVELKRDRAPETVDMQGLKYVALVSRFTVQELTKVHAKFLRDRLSREVTDDEALVELEEWAEVTEENLRLPRLVLMATSFPSTVTATVVFLHQQLGLDVRLLTFQAYRTGLDVLVTVSQHYPPPDIEEFVLSPEVNEARKQRTQRQARVRDLTTVARLIEASALTPGQRLEFRATSEPARNEVDAWIAEIPDRRWATWTDDHKAPLQWEADGETYTPTGLARHILSESAGRTGQVQGPLYWVDDMGHTLVELAADLPVMTEVPFTVHEERVAPALKEAFKELDQGLLALGDDVRRVSRARGIRYFASRKFCDVLVHQGHLSVYIRGLNLTQHPASGVVVGSTRDYVHAQIKAESDVPPVLELVAKAYAAQTA